MAKPPETPPNARVVSSAGCATDDKLHFNSEGSRKLGTRYGGKMLSLPEVTTGEKSKNP